MAICEPGFHSWNKKGYCRNCDIRKTVVVKSARSRQRIKESKTALPPAVYTGGGVINACLDCGCAFHECECSQTKGADSS